MPTVTGFRYSFRNSIGNRRAFRDYAFFSRVPHFRAVVTKQGISPFYARFDLCHAERDSRSLLSTLLIVWQRPR